MTRPTINKGTAGYFITPGQRYQMHRARSARWEAERNRQQIPTRISRWRLLVDGLAITLCALIVAVAFAVVISQMRT